MGSDDESELEWFPAGVGVHEAKDESVDYKDVLFEKDAQFFPESEEDATFRGISLVEMMNARIKSESWRPHTQNNDSTPKPSENEGTRSICYLLVSHNSMVDIVGHVFDFMTNAENPILNYT